MNPLPRFPRIRQLSVSAAIATALMGTAGCSGPGAGPKAETVRPAYVMEVQSGASDTLHFVGEVRAAKRAELAFPVSGRVTSVEVEVGDTVRSGQVLAVMDPLPLKAQLSASIAELARAEAQLMEARQRMERVRRAQASDAVAASELGAVEAEVSAAAAAVRAASAQKDSASWSLQHATLRAPMAGTVVSRTLEPGQAAGPGAPVLAIDGDSRELSVLVPSRMAIKTGQTVQLKGDGADSVSRVLRVGARLEAGGVRRVFLALPESASVGSTWSVALSTLRQEASPVVAQIPLRAVLPEAESGKGRVLRLAKDGRTVEAAPVSLGALHGDSVEILRGLAIGERVVVAGAAAIQPGTVVQPIAYKAAQGARP